MISDSFHYFVNFEILQWVKILKFSGRAESSLMERFYVLIHILVITLFIMFSVS